MPEHAETDHISFAASSPKVLALVVTWNRKILLEQVLRAILAQTRAVQGIILLDNGSTDGTTEHLESVGLLPHPLITYVRFDTNHGPAFGFHAGAKRALADGCDWLWIMDDDVIPDPEALAELLKAFDTQFGDQRAIGFLASLVVSPDGGLMNVPQVDARVSPSGYPDWNHRLAHGLVKVRQATFVSVLFPVTTLRDFGVPRKEFHIWGEDIDYTLTVTNQRPAYLVGPSRVVHCRAVAAPPNAAHETNPARIPLLFYYYRNQLYLTRRYYSWPHFVRQMLSSCKALVRSLIARPFMPGRAWAVFRGIVASFFFRPDNSATAPETSK